MGETEEARVIARFKKDVVEHMEVIEADVAKGDIADATLWVNELMRMREDWALRARKRAAGIGWVPDKAEARLVEIRESARKMAQARLAILDEAIKKGKSMIQSIS